MTLDEAIEHAKEVARTCDDPECAADHMQLAEWLRQARGTEKAARWYTAQIHELEGENMMLVMDRQGIKACYDNLSAQYSDLETENAKLREIIADVHETLCADRIGMFHNLIVSNMEEDMRELGIKVEE